MNISVKLAEIGHNVVVGTRNVAKTLARTSPCSFGQPPFSARLGQNPGIQLVSYAEAAGMAK